MTAMSKVVLLLAISAALTLSGSLVFAKTVGPGQVKTSGTSAAPSGSTSTRSKHVTPPRAASCLSSREGWWPILHVCTRRDHTTDM